MDLHPENFYGFNPQACVDVSSGILPSVYVAEYIAHHFYRLMHDCGLINGLQTVCLKRFMGCNGATPLL